MGPANSSQIRVKFTARLTLRLAEQHRLGHGLCLPQQRAQTSLLMPGGRKECHAETGESAMWTGESAMWRQESLSRGGRRECHAEAGESAMWTGESATWRHKTASVLKQASWPRHAFGMSTSAMWWGTSPPCESTAFLLI